MAKRPVLTAAELREGLASLDGWEVLDGKLHRSLRFGSFARAFGFMASVAVVAEAMNHHPEWRNIYDRVEIDLTTHDSGGITASDLALASEVDALAGRLS